MSIAAGRDTEKGIAGPVVSLILSMCLDNLSL